ncbi:MAG: hypothetical protein ABOK23_11725 [Candidatus Methanoperedens sp.]|nr:hypothetical protein [Candidatus Methanoperedens sp.]MCZ7395214.1 hypothetical protein [Candidatus Methanoperedens sp.]
MIGKLREDEEEFYWNMLIVERNYARTNRFWEWGLRIVINN